MTDHDAPGLTLRLDGRRVLVVAGEAAVPLARLALRQGAHVTLAATRLCLAAPAPADASLAATAPAGLACTGMAPAGVVPPDPGRADRGAAETASADRGAAEMASADRGSAGMVPADRGSAGLVSAGMALVEWGLGEWASADPALVELARDPRVTLAEGPPGFDGVRLCLTTDPAVAALARDAGVLCAVPGRPDLSDIALPPALDEGVAARPGSGVAGRTGHAVLAGSGLAAARPGRASLVGAGPGDPSLLTLRALQVLSEADIVLHDRLVGPAILDLAPAHARRIDVGKRCGRHAMSQAAINRLLVQEAAAGAHVVRLKGGDPFIFGRGGEELDCLRAAGLAVEIVPGVTAACAAAARLGIPLTHRDVSRSLHLVTGHGSDDRIPALDWNALAASGGTLALYMSTRTMDGVATRLIAGGLAGSTPAVAIENVSLPAERVRLATLATLPALLAEDSGDGPTLVLVGAVVGRLQAASQRAA